MLFRSANLPGEIETLEAEIAADQARMNEPDFFRQPPEQIKDFQTALADKEQKVVAVRPGRRAGPMSGRPRRPSPPG